MWKVQAPGRAATALVGSLVVASISVGASAAAPSVDWTTIGNGDAFGASSSVADIAAFDGAVVMVGATGDEVRKAAAWSSSGDGTWTVARLKAPKDSRAIAMTNWSDGLVAVGVRKSGDRRGLIWTSRSGEEWEQSALKGARLLDVAATPDGVAIVGTEDDTVSGTKYAFATMWTSKDARKWTPSRISFGVGQVPQRLVVSDEGVYVAAGYGEDMLSRDQPTAWRLQEDGSTWRGWVLPNDGEPGVSRFDVTGLAVTPVGFLAVLQTHPGQAEAGQGSVSSVLLSEDGESWDEVMRSDPYGPDGQPSLVAAARLGDGAMAIGAGGVWTTEDGIDWEMTPEPAFEGHVVSALITAEDGRLFAVGQKAADPGELGPSTWVGQSSE
jgi:hypothetical protein